MADRGAAPLKAQPIYLRLKDRQVPVEFDLRAWALLEQHYEAPSLLEAINQVAHLLARPKAADIIYIAWAVTRHMGDDAPDMDEVSTADLAQLLRPDNPLVAALQVGLPKGVQPPKESSKARAGIGRLRSLLSRLSGAGRKKNSGA